MADSTVTISRNICYGKARGYWPEMDGVEQSMGKAVSRGIFKSLCKHDFELTLDLYQPKGISGKHPLIVFIHGGAFYFGSKEEDAYVDFCKHFASLGYVTASINYRLGYRFNKKDVARAISDALEDSRKALDFLTDNAEEFHIDAERIFIAGSSSGAISAIALAFNGDGAERSYRIRAVANLWGGVFDLNMMRGGKASIVSFHGDRDTIVPYSDGYSMSNIEAAARITPGIMFGSSCIDRKAEELGLHHHLYTFHGEGHALNKDKNNKINDNHRFIKDKIAEFFNVEL